MYRYLKCGVSFRQFSLTKINYKFNISYRIIPSIKHFLYLCYCIHAHLDTVRGFDFNVEEIEKNFESTIQLIKTIFNEGLKNTPFNRIHLFYTLFTSFYHTKYGLRGLNKPQIDIPENKFERVKSTLTDLNILFDTVVPLGNISAEQIQFLEDSRRATTDTKVRVRRSEYILEIINAL